MSVALAPDEEAIVRAILDRILPAGMQVFVFVSRARGNPKPWSDLDLVLETGDGPVPLTLLAELAEAFDESALSWRADLVDRACVAPDFGRIIDAGKVAFA